LDQTLGEKGSTSSQINSRRKSRSNTLNLQSKVSKKISLKGEADNNRKRSLQIVSTIKMSNDKISKESKSYNNSSN